MLRVCCCLGDEVVMLRAQVYQLSRLPNRITTEASTDATEARIRKAVVLYLVKSLQNSAIQQFCNLSDDVSIICLLSPILLKAYITINAYIVISHKCLAVYLFFRKEPGSTRGKLHISCHYFYFSDVRWSSSKEYGRERSQADV